MEGINPELVALMNEKLLLFKKDTEVMIAERDTLIIELRKRISKYESVDEDLRVLVYKDIDEVCDALLKIYPEAHVLVNALVKAASENHFNVSFYEAITGELLSEDLKRQIFLKLDRAMEVNLSEYQRFTLDFSKKLDWVNTFRSEMTASVIKIRKECNAEIERQQQIFEAEI